MPKTIQSLLPQYLSEIQKIYGSHLKFPILGICLSILQECSKRGGDII